MKAKVKNMDKIGMWEKISYGAGEFGFGIVSAVLASLIMAYYTDSVLISAAVVGSIVGIAKIFDAFLDISAGLLVDKFNSRFGKTRGWILYMSIPFLISTIVLFSVPSNMGNTGKAIYVAITYFVFNIIYSFIYLPYSVENTYMTLDPKERSSLSIIRMIFVSVSAMAGMIFVQQGVLIFSDKTKKVGDVIQKVATPQSWLITMSIVAIVAFLIILNVFFSTKERIKYTEKDKENLPPLKKRISDLFKNKHWLNIVAISFLQQVDTAIMGGVFIYYCTWIFKNPNLFSIMSIVVTFFGVLAAITINKPLVNRFGKRNTALIGTAVCIVANVGGIIFWNNAIFTIVFFALLNVGAGFIGNSIYAFLGDTASYGEYKNGYKNEGLIYSGQSFAVKLGGGVGLMITGFLLAFFQYNPNPSNSVQSDFTIFGLVIMLKVIPLIISILRLIILLFYKLDDQLPEIYAGLKKKRAMEAVVSDPY